MPPDRLAFETTIFRRIERMPPDKMRGDGTLYVKVAFHDQEPGDDAAYGNCSSRCHGSTRTPSGWTRP
jgi:hypothetical protein